MRKSALLILFALTYHVCFSQKSKSPLMGWSSWNHFAFDINESVIKDQADAMVSSGLLAAGYNYLNIDDGFYNGRYTDGGLRIDSSKFPGGMKYLADYIHSKGLKAGFYTDAGANTCGALHGNQSNGFGGGIYGHDQQDADTIIKTWGFDFLKADYCGGLEQKLDERTRYEAIFNAINQTGRKDVNYNVCRWEFPGTWVTKIADSWRVSADIYLSWSSIMYNFDKNAYLAAYCSPGHYNDMDMLQVGRGLSFEEDKSHFSLWSIMSSPLILGNDMKNMPGSTKSLLTNPEVISVNQDSTGLQAKIVTDNAKGLQVWAKALNGRLSNERAVVLFNRTSATAKMSVYWKDLNLIGPASVRNLWTRTDLGIKDSVFTAFVPSHGVVMLKVVGSGKLLQETFEAEYGWINNFNLTLNGSIIKEQGIASVDTMYSGRAKASWLGNGAENYLEFRDVYANVAGNYILKITYTSGENRNAVMTVNNKDTLLTSLNSGNWSTLKTNAYNIILKQGYNTIRFSNVNDWMPDFDKIHIDLNKFNAKTDVGAVPVISKINIYPNPCTDFFEVESESPVKQVEIFSLTGSLVMTSSDVKRINITSLKSGLYLIKIFDDNGIRIIKIQKE